jgi:hypothetical protein
VIETSSPEGVTAVIVMSDGRSVMLTRRCLLPGSRHSAHGQLARSHTAAKPRSSRCPAAPVPVTACWLRLVNWLLRAAAWWSGSRSALISA